MTDEKKNIIRLTLRDTNLSAQDKYIKILTIVPNYLTVPGERKVIYEKIEGIFHDGLGTYFELLVYDKINIYYQLNQPEAIKDNAINKIASANGLYNVFFPNNYYKVDWGLETNNMNIGANNTLYLIKNIVGNRKVIKVSHTARGFKEGKVGDISIETSETSENINISLKIQKSGRTSLSEGQTSDIFGKVYNRYFNLSEAEYIALKLELFGTIDERVIFEDFENISLLTQIVFIKQLGIVSGGVNNMGNGIPTNKENLTNLVNALKYNIKSKDGSIPIGINRLTGEIIDDYICTSIDSSNIHLSDISFLPSIPKKYKYGSEPGLKYKGDAFVTFQVKKQRGVTSSQKFTDITIRLKIRKKSKISKLAGK